MVFARVTWFGAAGLVKSSEFGQYRLILNKHEAKTVRTLGILDF